MQSRHLPGDATPSPSLVLTCQSEEHGWSGGRHQWEQNKHHQTQDQGGKRKQQIQPNHLRPRDLSQVGVQVPAASPGDWKWAGGGSSPASEGEVDGGAGREVAWTVQGAAPCCGEKGEKSP